MAINPAVSQSFVNAKYPDEPFNPFLSTLAGVAQGYTEQKKTNAEDIVRLLPTLINSGQASATTETGPGTIQAGGMRFKLTPQAAGEYPVRDWSDAMQKLKYQQEQSGELSNMDAMKLFQLISDKGDMMTMKSTNPEAYNTLVAMQPQILAKMKAMTESGMLTPGDTPAATATTYEKMKGQGAWIRMKKPDGKVVEVQSDSVNEALAKGYKKA